MSDSTEEKVKIPSPKGKIPFPMLAASPPEQFNWLRFPWGKSEWLASPKIDGVRVVCWPEWGPRLRGGGEIPNKLMRMTLAHPAFVGLDGELTLKWDDPEGFEPTRKAVLSEEWRGKWEFCVFDSVNSAGWPFALRSSWGGPSVNGAIVRCVPQFAVANTSELEAREREFLDQGFEGLMLRDANAKYKFGRSTWAEKGLVKLKRYAAGAGEVTGVERREADGQMLATVRGGNGVGFALVVRGEERNWPPEALAGKFARYKWLPYGSGTRPRHAVWRGILQ